MESQKKSSVDVKNLEEMGDITKKCYIAPVLTVYGSINDITRSVGRPVNVDAHHSGDTSA